MKRFLLDALIGMICIGLIGGVFFALAGTPLGIILALGFGWNSPALGYIGVGAMLLVLVVSAATGVLWKRPGYIASPFLLYFFASAGSYVVANYELSKAHFLEMRQFDKPHADHQIIVMPSFDYSCYQECIQLLVETEHSVVVQARTGRTPTLYRKAQGEDCYKAENIEMLARFTEAGFAGLCATKSPAPQVSDALIITKTYSSLYGESPRLFRGNIFDFIERINGKDRLLGRWITGFIDVDSKPTVGSEFDDVEFYEAALGRAFAREGVFGHDDILTRIQMFEPALGAPDVPKMAIYSYGTLVRDLAKIAPENAKDRIQALTSSKNPRQREIGLSLLSILLKLDADATQRIVLEGLRDADMRVVSQTIESLRYFSEEDRSFARDTLAMLALSLAPIDNYQSLSSLFSGVGNPLKPEQREQAKEILLGSKRVTAGQRSALWMIIARGSSKNKKEADDIIEQLKKRESSGP